MKPLAILQARVSSTRLPGKVLRPLLGVPLLLRQVERVLRSRNLGELVIATSIDPSDDPLAELCRSSGLACFRGSLNDVLDRFYRVAEAYGFPTHVVRLTGDCPLTDPDIIDAVISFHFQGNYDYSSNAIAPTWPDGLDVEVFRGTVLARAWREATEAWEREHVTQFMLRKDLFSLGNYQAPIDLSHLRWTVDEPRDFDFVEQVYRRLWPGKPAFTSADVLQLLDDHPELAELNSSIRRNEGLTRPSPVRTA